MIAISHKVKVIATFIHLLIVGVVIADNISSTNKLYEVAELIDRGYYNRYMVNYLFEYNLTLHDISIANTTEELQSAITENKLQSSAKKLIELNGIFSALELAPEEKAAVAKIADLSATISDHIATRRYEGVQKIIEEASCELTVLFNLHHNNAHKEYEGAKEIHLQSVRDKKLMLVLVTIVAMILQSLIFVVGDLNPQKDSRNYRK